MIKRTFATLLAAILFAGLFGSLAGCNTVAGVGHDIERGGRAIENKANEKR